MEFLTKSAYAAARNWSKPYVSKLAKQGRLVLNSAGLIDVAATDELIAKTSDPSKGGVAGQHLLAPQENLLRESAFTPAALGDQIPPQSQLPDFQKARARREHFTSLTVEADFYKNQGTLVEMAAVDAAAYSTGRLLRDLLLGVPTQIAPELAAMSDPWHVEKHLLTAIRRALEDAERMSAADLQHALTKPEHSHA